MWARPPSVAITAILLPLVVILLYFAWQIEVPRGEIESRPANDSASTGLILAGYFINWGIYDRKYNVIDLANDAHKLSHVLYCFANLDTNGTIILGDPWADTDKPMPAELAIDHHGDQQDDDLHGNLRQFHLLKKQHRQLKVSLSVGGWSWSTNFSTVAVDPERRAHFTSSAMSLLSNLGFDGLDIDWEFPHDEKEAAGYVALLREMRQAFDEYEQKTGTRMILSVAMPCGEEHYRTLDLGRMNEAVDVFYLMAYDFAGAWDDHTGHQSPLYGGISAAVDYYSQRVDRQKIVLGLPVYGRGFSETQGLDKPFHGVPKGSWEEGSYDYKDLPHSGAKEYFDDKLGASWSYDAKGREFVTYDTVEAIQNKCQYIKQQGLGGAMFWELSADHHGEHPRSLLNTVYTCFASQVDQTSNEIRYPMSPYPLFANA